jgi:crotonobetainyl-CoA:carnitine CoA-transferase CaiB-like acyl-CoA transferase
MRTFSPRGEASAFPTLPLSGFRALDLADEWGYLCGRILADLGAEVIKVEPPGGDPGRRLGPFLDGAPDPEKSLYWLANNTDKCSLVLDLERAGDRERLVRLLATADFLIESFRPGYLAARGLAYSDLRGGNPALVHTTITPFGATGPYAGRPSSDLIACAASGWLFVSGKPETPPVRVSLPQSYAMAAAQAAAGTMLAHYCRLRTGRGQQVEVSAQEAMTNALMRTSASWDTNQTIERRGGGPRQTIWRCADGWIAWTWWTGPGWGRKNLPLLEWMDELGAAADLLEVPWEERSLFEVAPAEKAHWERVWARFFARFTRAELYAEAVKRRILLYPVNAPADMLADPQALARALFIEIAHDELGGSFAYPGPFARPTAYRLGPYRRAPRIGEWGEATTERPGDGDTRRPGRLERRRPGTDRAGGAGSVGAPGERGEGGEAGNLGAQPPAFALSPLPALASAPPPLAALSGLKVLDLSWALAGPLTTRTLAIHGAEVIKVEWRKRPDAARVTAPFLGNRPGINNASAFSDFNAGKLGVAIDLARPEGRDLVLRLAERADIVVENFSPGVVDRLGVGYGAVRALRPDTIYLSLSMQGQSGPHADHPGLGNLLQALVGLESLCGWPEDRPAGPNELYPDFIGPWFAVCALLAALAHRDRTGEGQHIDLAQTDTALQFLAPAILDYTFKRHTMTRQGNRDPNAAPHGVYLAADGGRQSAVRRPEEERWLALAVETDAQWQALCNLAPEEPWPADPRFGAFAGRKQHEDALDAAVAAWVYASSAEALAERLAAAAVPAAVVANGEDLFRDPQLAYREHFVWLEHPVLGRRAHQQPAFRLSETPARLARGPLLGEHTGHVLRDLLGCDDDQIGDLLAAGVIATE